MNKLKEHRLIMIFSRKKDNPNQRKSTMTIFQEIVRTERIREKIPMYKTIAKFCNARIYMSVNAIDFKKARREMINRLLKQEFENFETNIHRTVISSCIRSYLKPRKFIIDIDTKDPNIIQEIYKRLPLNPDCLLETKNGYHMICEPFNIKEFMNYNIPDVKVKREGMTTIDYLSVIDGNIYI